MRESTCYAKVSSKSLSLRCSSTGLHFAPISGFCPHCSRVVKVLPLDK